MALQESQQKNVQLCHYEAKKRNAYGFTHLPS